MARNGLIRLILSVGTVAATLAQINGSLKLDIN